MNRLLKLLILLLSSTLLHAGDPGTFVRTADGIIVYPDPLLTQTPQSVKLEVVNSSIIRVLVIPAGAIPKKSLVTVYGKPVTEKWTVDSTGSMVSIKTSRLIVSVELNTGRVSFYETSGKKILAEQAVGGRKFVPQVFEGQPSFSLSQSFETTTSDTYYGLGQHQDDVFNYKGQQVKLFQNNTEVAIPFLISSLNYGILWDNYSLTSIGDTRPYMPLSSLRLFSADGEEGWLTASYFNDKTKPSSRTLSRPESVIDMEFVNESKLKLPVEFTPATGLVTYEGSLSSANAGIYKFRFIYGGYLKVWMGGKLVIDRWRKAWNPAPALINLPLNKNEKVAVRIEWIPEGGESYFAVKYQEPKAADLQNVYGFSSEAGQAVDYYFVSGANMDEVIGGYRTLSGKANIVPRWALGFWQSRERYHNQEEILSTVAEFRRRKIPLDNIVLDWFYWKENEWGSQEFDPVRFPSPDSMISVLHKKYNTQLMISVWPKFYETVPAYKDFNARGWLYKRNIADGQKDWVGPGYKSTFYDAFNEDARKGFWKLINEKIYVKGVDAWWMDASEPDILSNVSPERRKQQMTPVSGGLVAEDVNAYPLQNAKGIYEGQRSVDPDKRVFLLTRSGFAGSQRYSAVIWSGDIGARWDDMKAQIPAGINFSLSGLPYWTMDIGGFVVEDRYQKPNAKDLEEWRELMTRWFQFGAFVPVFRVHGQAPKREIFHTAPEDHPAYRSMLYYNQLRYRLLPYIYSLAGMAYHNDYTIMRGLVMDFPADSTARTIGDQFLLGPSLLVNPVYVAGMKQRTVYLPAGGWYDLYTGKYEEGGKTIVADAPYMRMPVFVKAGSILPTGPALQYTAEKKADTIWVHVYQGANGSFSLYEDEGLNYDYEKGLFANIPMEYNEKDQTLVFGERQGKFPGMMDKRVFLINYIRKGRPVNLDLQSARGKLVHYDGTRKIIRLN
ncbi:MAG: TIM-barrel domain-containing protein [Chitinophagaceae bacterium]